MKKILLVALIAATVFANTCPSNPYLQTRSSFYPPLVGLPNVGIYSDPTKCGGEWKQHGVCCDVAGINAHLEADTQRITKAADTLNLIFDSLNAAADTFLNQVIKVAHGTSPIPQGRGTPGMKAGLDLRNAAKGFLCNLEHVNTLRLNFDSDLHKEVEVKQQLMNDFMQRKKRKRAPPKAKPIVKKSFHHHSKQCWNTIIRLRSASMCSVCSGRNSVFFKGAKGVTTLDYCDQALDSCYEVLKITGRIFKLIYWIFSDPKVFRDLGIAITYQGDLQVNGVRRQR